MSMQREPLTAIAFAVAMAVAQAATAQSTDATRPFQLTPYVSLTGTVTDNIDLSSANERSDFLLRATAGLRVFARNETLSGTASYSLTRASYARSSERNEWLNALDAAGTAELARGRFFIDAAANVSQQMISALGVQSPDPARDRSNRSEVATLSVVPRLQGRLGGAVDYRADVRYTATNSADEDASDSRSVSAGLDLASVSSPWSVRWGLSGRHNQVGYNEGRRVEDDIVRATLGVPVTVDLVLTAIAGWEGNNFQSADKEGNDLWGARAEWTPSGRTRLFAEVEHRFFGTARSIDFSYRTPQTAWSFADRRDVSTSQSLSPLRSVGSAFDLLYAQFATVQPDPLLRRDLVDQYLRSQGIDPSTQVLSRFLSSTATLQNDQRLSGAWIGARATLTVTAARGSTRRLDTLSPVAGDLATEEEIRQRALSVQLAYRLTPSSSLSAQAGQENSKGVTTGTATRLRSVSAGWTASLTPRSAISVNLRTASFSSPTSPYRESTLSASYRLEL